MIPTRPTVTDGGDVIAVVPRTETSPLAEAPAPPPPPASVGRARTVRGGQAGAPDGQAVAGSARRCAPTART